MVRQLRVEFEVAGYIHLSRKKNIASESTKVSERENDNFLFLSQQKERFLNK